MAVNRSPNYPQIDLSDALEAIKPAYKEEGRMKMSKSVLSQHLGYSSVNGRALAKIGAVRAYGLIDGKEDELRISSEAIDCLEAPLGSPERASAIARCAFKPSIFQDIRGEYDGRPSEHNLRFYLIKRGFTPEAASKAAQNYLSTVRLVDESGGTYNDGPMDEEPVMESATQARHVMRAETGEFKVAGGEARLSRGVPPGMRQSVFPLDEGDVTLTFPANLSSDGYAELKEYLDIFLRRAERSKRLEEAQEDFKDPPPN